MDFRGHGFVSLPSVQEHEVQRRKQSICGIQSGEDKGKDDSIENVMTDFSNVYASDLLPSKHGGEFTEHFLLELVDILLCYIRKTFDEEIKILDFRHPHQLLEGLDGFNLELSDQPEALEQLLVDCSDTLKYGVETGYPRFFNQLSNGPDMIGWAAEWLTATANTNMFTYEISPVFIVMEMILLKKMHEIIFWGETEADGIFSSGGNISNLYGILVARYKKFPQIKTKGMAVLPQIVLFVSEHSHYSIRKTAAVLGIGTNNVIEVKCDERGKMIPLELEESILQAKRMGLTPFRVSATAGTTAYGAFDPLDDIADACERHSLWMHVDGLLESCNQVCAEYLFQPDKHYDVGYDIGDKTIQCGQRVDIFKLWLMWKAKGTSGFEVQINTFMELADYLYKSLKKKENFELVFDGEPELTNVCFWYIPPRLKSISNEYERQQELQKIAPKIKALMTEEGTTMLSYQPLGDKVKFF